MYGSKVIRSTYAELVLEAVEGGGLMLAVTHPKTADYAGINLSAAQVTEMRQWMDTDRETE